MKEAPSSKKMPRKPPIPPAPGTPTKAANDEILSALLRSNNFDSSIKDESLDIDLSACVTITADSAALIGANSLSSTDFWRVLDENAQTVHLDLTTSSNDALEDVAGSSNASSKSANIGGSAEFLGGSGCELGGSSVHIKQEQPSSFSGTFLRPEVPAPSSSPLKRNVVRPQSLAEQQHNQFKLKSGEELKSSKLSQRVKEEPEEPLPLLSSSIGDDIALDGVGVVDNSLARSNTISTHLTANAAVSKTISSSSFSIFMLSGAADLSKTAPDAAVVPQLAPQEPPDDCNSSTEPTFKCLNCDGLILRGQQEFNTHEAIGHRVLYCCNACNRDFEQGSALKKHIKTHRSMDARKDAWKKCPDCGKCLKLGSMWMHRKIHSDNKKYGCDICGQKFVQKINLTHHSRVHTAEKPYECPECQKRFQERSHLQRHQKYHAQTRSYRCEKCGKMYKTERCLKVHNLVHLEQRPFACNVCDKSFISNSKLKQHSNIHTGERPFKCNYCPRDFTNFPNWLKHTRRRHKVDHKTGEHLENIPSYCSKKSSKTAKQQKPPEATAEGATSEVTSISAKLPPQHKDQTPKESASVSVPNITIPVTSERPENEISTGAVLKAQQSKRKKKVYSSRSESTAMASPAVNCVVLETSTSVNVNRVNLVNSTTTATCSTSTTSCLSAPIISAPILSSALSNNRAPKAKRERKQLSPKQVQKQPHMPLLSTVPIKREVVEAKTKSANDAKILIGNYPDLSITSAEDLIMEQALEMEECGLYATPSSSAVDTDNAISASEAAAALHFKIKNEFIADSPRIKEEDFIPLKDINQRLLCSSLESSPFSSPASTELGTTSTASSIMNSGTVLPVTTSTITTAASTSGTYFMPSFTLNPHGTVITNLTGTMPSICTAEAVHNSQAPVFSPSGLVQTNSITSTQALINHFYLHPMTINMPLLMQPSNQMLPPVDTLLFATATNDNGTTNGIFHNKNAMSTTTQQKLS